MMSVHDVTDLMITSFDGNAVDKFGRDASPRRCLLLESVMPNRHRASSCKLFQMPSEILAEIVDMIADDKSSLSSLALVNSDCRYLARSCQFAEIRFDYSIRSLCLFAHLAKEVYEIKRGEVPLYAIGTCVRRVIFASDPGCVRAAHPELYSSIFGERRDAYTDERRNDLRKGSNTFYELARECSILAISHTMPNLEMLAWEDSYTVDQEFFKAISRSSAHHLRLSRMTIHDTFRLEPPLTADAWPLRSLHLNLNLAISASNSAESSISNSPDVKSKHPLSSFFGTLFQLCAPTLETLHWSHFDIKLHSQVVSLDEFPLAFPRLQHLQLGLIRIDPLTFSMLLVPTLKHLALPRCEFKSLKGCLAASEPLRDLESLVISCLPRPYDEMITFIKKHNFVRKLSIHDNARPPGEQGLDFLIIPILAEGLFRNLTCLSLQCGTLDNDDRPMDAHISEAALKTIGKIESLERLHLSVGFSFGWKCQWLIDHNAMRHSLATLKKLTMLAFERDTYRISAMPSMAPELYYSARLVGNDERELAEMRSDIVKNDQHIGGEDDEDDEDDEIWERAHRNRMLTEAEAYAALFPQLEWLLCGQRPIGFSKSVESSTAPRKAVPLTTQRDECYTFLQETFGLGE
ncbi:hypothetical protein VHEMI01659 [[Torrubiella] hemipterigena]|uniref:F-box domain-containing protein n=1 Tax=[Torrubiella] hemipterigena TaxID=1531966 RepID=A0A0A1SMH1_9HYPO|nr:hypothetical protein VHEMI01659 [[Torrubiella] hemipterigena]